MCSGTAALHILSKDEILVTVGGSEAIDLGFRALLNPGDEVLIPEPCFVCYEPLSRMAGGVAVPIVTRAEDGFRLTAAGAAGGHHAPDQNAGAAVPQQPDGGRDAPRASGGNRRGAAGNRNYGAVGRDLRRADLWGAGACEHHLPAGHAGSHAAGGRVFQGVCHDRLEAGTTPAGRSR